MWLNLELNLGLNLGLNLLPLQTSYLWWCVIWMNDRNVWKTDAFSILFLFKIVLPYVENFLITLKLCHGVNCMLQIFQSIRYQPFERNTWVSEMVQKWFANSFEVACIVSCEKWMCCNVLPHSDIRGLDYQSLTKISCTCQFVRRLPSFQFVLNFFFFFWSNQCLRRFHLAYVQFQVYFIVQF